MKQKIIFALLAISLWSCSVKTHQLMNEKGRPCMDRFLLQISQPFIKTYRFDKDEVKVIWYVTTEGEANIIGESLRHLYVLLLKNKDHQSELFDLGYFKYVDSVSVYKGYSIEVEKANRLDSTDYKAFYKNYLDGSTTPPVENDCLKYFLEGLTPESIASFEYSYRKEQSGVKIVTLQVSDPKTSKKRYDVYVAVGNDLGDYPDGKVDFLGTFDEVSNVEYDKIMSVLSFDYVQDGKKGKMTYDAKKWSHIIR